MEHPRRIAIIGTSFVSDWICGAAKATEACEIAAVYSREEARAKAFAEKAGIPLASCDMDAFLSSPEFDAVYVASPNASHYHQTLAALEHGKHVLCEKPLAINASQAARMISFAHETGLVLIEAIRPVYDPFLVKLKEYLPMVGRVRRATFEFCQ